VGGFDLLSLVVSADLDPPLAAELPAAVHAGLAGDSRPLLRLADLFSSDSGAPDQFFSAALFTATVCADGLFAWDPGTPAGSRQPAIDAVLAALPPGSTGSFGLWAAGAGISSLCMQWPSPAGNTPLATGPLPDVPVLALSGDVDMRTPTAEASRIVSAFPQGKLVVVPGVGHSVLFADSTGCASRAVRAWFQSRPIETCKRVPAIVLAVPAYSTSLASEPEHGAAGNPGRTGTAVMRTIAEAEATWVMMRLAGIHTTLSGLSGGTLTASSNDGFLLGRYSDVPGVALTGTIDAVTGELPLRFTGTVKVSGAGAAHGTVTITRRFASGVLGGVKLRPSP
jgi:hypothetical protein